MNQFFRLKIEHTVTGTQRTAVVFCDDEETALLGAGVTRDESAVSQIVTPWELGLKGLFASRTSSPNDLAVFFQTLNDCLRVGTSVTSAVEMAAAQQTAPYLAGVVGQMLRELRSGATFSEAMGRFENVFDESTVAIVRAGENSGNLEEVFQTLANTYGRRSRLRGQIQKSLSYPGLVLGLMLLVIVYVSTTLVPAMANTYSQFKAELPLMTQAVILISNILRGEPVAWVLGIGVSVAVWVHRRAIFESESFQAFALSLPIVGQLWRQMANARALRTLAMLLSAGVRSAVAFELAARAAGNGHLRTALHGINERVAAGEDLATAFARHETAFGPIGARLVAFLRVGVHTGKPENVLGKMADEADIEVDRAALLLDKVLEPALLAILSVCVGGLVFAVYYPMFNLGKVMLH